MNVNEFSLQFDVLYNNIMDNDAPGLDEYERVMDRRVKYIFADMEEADRVFKTKQPVLIIEVEDEE